MADIGCLCLMSPVAPKKLQIHVVSSQFSKISVKGRYGLLQRVSHPPSLPQTTRECLSEPSMETREWKHDGY